MRLEPKEALHFIDGYKKLLLEVLGESAPAKGSVLPMLIKARAKLVKEPTLLQEAQARLEARAEGLDLELFQALQGLEVQNWIYLRDTRSYSILMDPDTERAFGVVGLTNRLREIIGGSGAYIETGVLRYKERFVCDGIVTKVVWLGRNYLRSFGETFAELKAKGKFFK